MRFGLAVVLCAVSGCGGSSVPEQIGEACTEIGEVFCERAIDCGFIAGNEQLSCVNAFFEGCCANDGVCNAEVDQSITSDEYQRCLDGIEAESCDDINNGNVPSACLSL